MFVVENAHRLGKVDIRFYCGRKSSYKPHYGVFIDLGNLIVSSDSSQRDKTCDAFEALFISEQERFLPGLRKIFRAHMELSKTITNPVVGLVCFCNPKRCHCDTYKRFLDKYI
jgi:hypothetical protein